LRGATAAVWNPFSTRERTDCSANLKISAAATYQTF